jgi:hypothetical protein
MTNDTQVPSETMMQKLRRRVGEAMKDFETNEDAVVVTDEVLTKDLLALVECAEALKLIAQWADEGRHEEDFNAIGNKARACLAKLEPL